MTNIFDKNISPRLAILLTIVLAAVGYLFFMALGLVISALIAGHWDLAQLASSFSTSDQGLMGTRILQMLMTMGIFLFPAIVVARIASNEPLSLLGFKKFSFNYLWMSILFMVMAIPGINLIASLNALIPMPIWMIDMENSAEMLLKALLITDNLSIFAINFLMIAVIPAIAEELFFRGILQKYICKLTKSNLWGIIITAFIFSAIHLQFQGFFPRFLLGLIFGYLYVWSGSIWIPIAAHFANNGVATFGYYLIGKGIVSTETETIGSLSDVWPLGLGSIAISMLMLWVIWMHRVQESPKKYLI